jgi:tight adherence protein C
MTMLLVLAAFCLAGAAYLLGEIATAPARQRWLSVRRAATYGHMEVPSGSPKETFGERFLAPLREWLAGWALKANPRMSVDGIALKLLAAGVGRRLSPTGFLALKGAMALAGLFFGTVFGRMGGIGLALLAALVLGGVGFFAPDYLLTLKARSRRERVRADLPDALDLLAVSVEAGLGFDAAVGKISEHMEGPLAEEFGLALSEMRIGESRQEALKRMAERVDAPELSAFVRAIIQADQLGTTLGRILRVQAADSRLRRQAAAEERAMKAPIKMLFPTVLFIFPAMFLVILGPAILNVQELF